MRTLHFWPLDPFSRQVRLVLEEKSLRHDLQLEVPWERPDDLLSLNPAGTTPVLIDESGGGRRVIVESRAILEYLEETGDPATDLPIGPTGDNLKAAVAGETHEYTDMYPGMAKTARQEGFDEIADWFETLAKAEKSHAGRFQKALDELD